MNEAITALRIEAEGFVIHSDGLSDLRIERGNRSDWAQARALTARHRRLTVRIPAFATLPLLLPAVPRNASEMRDLLADASPVRPADLAWTAPSPVADGGASTIVVRRSWLDDRLDEVERELGLAMHLIVEPTGDRLPYRPPAIRRRNWVTAGVVAASLAIAGLALVPLAPAQRRGAAAAPTMPLPAAAMPSPPGISATLLALQRAPVPLASLARGPTGQITVDIDAPDPDLLRTAVAATGYREVAQRREADAGYRLTFAVAGPQSAVKSYDAPALVASSRERAVAAFSDQLTQEARSRVVALSLASAPGWSGSTLEFAVALAGPQAAVLGLADAIESGSPPARFRDWRVMPDTAGLRLTGTLIVPLSMRP